MSSSKFVPLKKNKVLNLYAAHSDSMHLQKHAFTAANTSEPSEEDTTTSQIRFKTITQNVNCLIFISQFRQMTVCFSDCMELISLSIQATILHDPIFFLSTSYVVFIYHLELKLKFSQRELSVQLTAT